MSRRRGRAHHHERPRQSGPRPGSPTEPRAVQAADPSTAPIAPIEPPTRSAGPPVEARNGAPADAPAAARPVDRPVEASAPARPANGSPSNGVPANGAPTSGGPVNGGPVSGAPANGGPGSGPRLAPPVSPGGHGGPGMNGGDRGSACTAPQLRRFIKSRPYVPMHELRRRFAIEAGDDDVSPIDLDLGRIFVGLPVREGQLLGELVRAGEVGYELSLDPRTPVVIGVYPMRPVPRP